MKLLTFLTSNLAVAVALLAAIAPTSNNAPRGSGLAFADGNTLFIYGTDLVDRVQLKADSDPNKFSFRLNGVNYRFNVRERVYVFLGKGDDLFTNGFTRLSNFYPNPNEGVTRVRVYGEEGNDRLQDRTNTIFIEGGVGDDLLISSGDGISGVLGYAYGGEGNDVIYGGSGDNDLIGGPGDDEIYGGGGNDFIIGDEGDDFLHGGTGDDSVSGGVGENIVVGGSGDDYVETEGDPENSDTCLFGGSGNDELVSYGASAGSCFYGGSGDDEFYDSEGDDYIIGGEGDDDIYSQSGTDVISGGAGNDTFYAYGSTDSRVYGNSGQDEFFGYEGILFRQ
jgi:Ca2+-binding RTX toxin-like protein